MRQLWLGLLFGMLTLQPPLARSQGITPSTYYGVSHALLIGVNHYEHLPADKQLQFAVNDVQALKKLLVRSYGFTSDHITTLTDGQATRAAIERALSALADRTRVQANDRILIYFSGHGETVEIPGGASMGFLVPTDADAFLLRQLRSRRSPRARCG